MTVFRLAAAGLLAAAAAVVIGVSTAGASDWPTGTSRAADGNEWLLGPDCSDWPSGVTCAAPDNNEW